MYRPNCEIKEGVEFPQGMYRWALAVEYHGASFSGFQKQASAANTIQSCLEKALSQIANEPITLVCAGRTDAGVHASGQIVHFDTKAVRPDRAWVHGANTALPDDIRVCWARQVPPEFHARFSALSRTYRYVLYCADVRPACMHKSLTWTAHQLDISRMQLATEFLVGEHDFSSFRSAQCQAHSPIRTVKQCEIYAEGPFIVMQINANAFLHHMVRNIVGVMLDIGRGVKPPEWMGVVRDLRDRTKSAPTARPWGLYLVKVEYPTHFDLPVSQCGPVFLMAPRPSATST